METVKLEVSDGVASSHHLTVFVVSRATESIRISCIDEKSVCIVVVGDKSS